MRCYSLFIGARNRRAGPRVFLKRDDALVRQITAQHFPDGFTILDGRGAGYNPKLRRIVLEESRQVLVSTKSRSTLRAWAKALAAALDQHEILLVELGRAITIPRGGMKSGPSSR